MDWCNDCAQRGALLRSAHDTEISFRGYKWFCTGIVLCM